MNKVIYKYPLRGQLETLPLAADVEILTAQVKTDGRIYLWAMGSYNEPNVERIFEIIGTGQPIVEIPGYEREYISTIQQGEWVWHVFERVPNKQKL